MKILAVLVLACFVMILIVALLAAANLKNGEAPPELLKHARVFGLGLSISGILLALLVLCQA